MSLRASALVVSEASNSEDESRRLGASQKDVNARDILYT